ncbi:MAG: UPF0365 family protein [Gemmataceae bacterium]|nr:UPF0365 family protein [Gemmataceae bacterium]
MSPLFANGWTELLTDGRIWLIGFGMFFIVLAIIFLFVFLSFLNLWIQCVLTGADISIWGLLWMKLRKVNYEMIVKQKIALVQAGVKIATAEMEAHYLSGGNVEKTVLAVIAAHKAGIELSWGTAAAIDLAGRDVLDAVRTSVNPKVIDCPDPLKGKAMLEGVCKNGIRLKARARVTVRTKLERLIGGATEETIIARVGEGIVAAIGAAEFHADILANPHRISEAVLKKGLDSQTAFEIVSIDIAELDVGDNVGARLAAKKAESDLRVAQAQAEVRRAAAVAREQEMKALVEENRAKVVEAEAEIPMAMSEAFRAGNLGVGEYYNLKNVQADTSMRNAIANGSKNSDSKDCSGK